MRITSKGQVTIPTAIRRRLGLLKNTEVELDVVGDSVRVRKARNRGSLGQAIVARMRGRATSRLSTDQILALTRGKRERQPRP
ncbi:MAG: AbrB/MazE/SpoVT family DNA-binding domain-containing protein [Vicinamibacteria bacterium]